MQRRAFNIGQHFYEQGNLSQEIFWYTVAIWSPQGEIFGGIIYRGGDREAPVELAQLYAYRGKAYSENQDFGNAISDLSKALELQPDEPSNVTIHLLRGYCHYQRKDFDKAMADYLKAKEINPDSNDCEFRKFVALLQDEKTDFSFISKIMLFNTIKQLPDDLKIPLLERCLDKNTALGKRMWKNEFPWTGCSYESGTLNLICDELVRLKPGFVRPSTTPKVNQAPASQLPVINNAEVASTTENIPSSTYQLLVSHPVPLEPVYIPRHKKLPVQIIPEVQPVDNKMPIVPDRQVNQTPALNFEDFKKEYYRDYEKNPSSYLFSKMHYMLLFGSCSTMEKVKEYAKEQPDSRTAKLLNSKI